MEKTFMSSNNHHSNFCILLPLYLEEIINPEYIYYENHMDNHPIFSHT